MPIKSVEIPDARGVARPIPAPDYALRGGVYSDRRALSLQQARAALHRLPSPNPRRLVEAVALGVLFTLLLGFAAWRTVGAEDVWITVLGVLLLGAAGGWGLSRVRTGPPAMDRLDSGLAACRMCFSCGYDLQGLMIEPDGCLVCPECGAAWKATT